MNILDLARETDRLPSAVHFYCGQSGTIEELCVGDEMLFEPKSPFDIPEVSPYVIRQHADIPVTCVGPDTDEKFLKMLDKNTRIGAEYLLLNQVGAMGLTGVPVHEARADAFSVTPEDLTLIVKGSGIKAALDSGIVKFEREGAYTAWGDNVIFLEGSYETPLGTNLAVWVSNIEIQLMAATVESVPEARANISAYFGYRPVFLAVSSCGTSLVSSF